MQQFNIERPIPSLLVTKDLLASLQSYLEAKCAELAHKGEKQKTPSSRIVITDGDGDETVSSTADLHYTKFPNSTTRIHVKVESPFIDDGQRLRCTIDFSKGRLTSMATVWASGTGARELAVGCMDGLRRRFEPSRNSHWMYNPTPIISVLLWGSVLGVLPSAVFFPFSRVSGIVAGIAWSVLFGYLMIAKPLHPYCAFDSAKQQGSSKWLGWLMTEILGFILTAVILAYVVKRLLGL